MVQKRRAIVGYSECSTDLELSTTREIEERAGGREKAERERRGRIRVDERADLDEEREVT